MQFDKQITVHSMVVLGFWLHVIAVESTSEETLTVSAATATRTTSLETFTSSLSTGISTSKTAISILSTYILCPYDTYFCFPANVHTLGDFIFPLKPSFKLGFKPNFGLKPN